VLRPGIAADQRIIKVLALKGMACVIVRNCTIERTRRAPGWDHDLGVGGGSAFQADVQFRRPLGSNCSRESSSPGQQPWHNAKVARASTTLRMVVTIVCRHRNIFQQVEYGTRTMMPAHGDSGLAGFWFPEMRDVSGFGKSQKDDTRKY